MRSLTLQRSRLSASRSSAPAPARLRLLGLVAATAVAGSLLVPAGLSPASAAVTFVKGIDFGGAGAVVEGNSWVSQSAAQSAGFSTTATKTFSNSITWSPAADSGTSTMLNTVSYQSAASFTMSQTVANGSYDVYFWLTENYRSNARSENIRLEGVTVASNVGSMALNSWQKLGPYRATVTDGSLTMNFDRLSGDPQVAGLAIYSADGATPTPTPTPTPTVTPTPTPTPTPTVTTPPPGSSELKPRLVVLSDITSANWEPDDMQSFVHLLASADLFEIEGIVSTTGWSLDGGTPLQTYHFNDVIAAYEKDLPNLMKRSGQTGFLADERTQPIGYWPSPAYLRSLVAEGQPARGMGGVGAGKSTAGSREIIAAVDDPDPRPVWITLWGGGNTLAQAVWDVQNTRSAAQLNAFLAKLRVYAVTDQDRGYTGEGYANSSQFWLRKTFPGLFYIWAESAWGTYGSTIKNTYWSRYTSEVQGRGALGAKYPTWKYIVEGDSPSWLHLWPGLNDPQQPAQYGFGGRFVRGTGPDGQTQAYLDTGSAAAASNSAVTRTLPDQVNDFVSRIGWAQNGRGNRNPLVVVNGTPGYGPVVLQAAPGSTVTLNTAGTTDPDGNALSYGWTRDQDAGFAGTVTLSSSGGGATVQVPAAASGQAIHVVLRMVDNGTPPLATYRRVIIQVS